MATVALDDDWLVDWLHDWHRIRRGLARLSVLEWKNDEERRLIEVHRVRLLESKLVLVKQALKEVGRA